MSRIPNSGCLSQSFMNDLNAARKAKTVATWRYAVHCLKKDGTPYKRAFGDTGFRTLEDAEEKKAIWEKYNPNSRFIIVEI